MPGENGRAGGLPPCLAEFHFKSSILEEKSVPEGMSPARFFALYQWIYLPYFSSQYRQR